MPDKFYRKAQEARGAEQLIRLMSYFPTPAETTRALLGRILFEGNIWEPGCGEGDISKVLEEAGLEVMSSDLGEYEYPRGEWGVNFIRTAREVDNIITNPPWTRKTVQWARHAKNCARKRVAMLVRVNFLAGTSRQDVFSELRWVLVFKKRPEFVQGGKSLHDVAWFVWEKGWNGRPEVDWL